MSGHSLDNTVHVKRFEGGKYLYIVLSKDFYIICNVCLLLYLSTHRIDTISIKYINAFVIMLIKDKSY